MWLILISCVCTLRPRRSTPLLAAPRHAAPSSPASPAPREVPSDFYHWENTRLPIPAPPEERMNTLYAHAKENR